MMRVAHARREEATPMRERKERKKKRRKKRKTILYTFVALCLHNFYAFRDFQAKTPRSFLLVSASSGSLHSFGNTHVDAGMSTL